MGLKYRALGTVKIELPVASALWIPMPNFEIGAGAWILAGGTHHSCFSYALTPEYWEDYAEMAGIEMVRIDKNTTIQEFKKELRYNDVYYMLNMYGKARVSADCCQKPCSRASWH